MFDFEPTKEAGDFLSLKDGDQVVLSPQGDVRVFHVIWENKKPQEVPEGTRDSTGKKAGFRFIVNVWNKEAQRFQLFEQGWTVYQAIKGLEKSGYDMRKIYLTIGRTGSGMDDTVYTVVPTPNGTISDEEMAEIQSHELMPLIKPEGK